MRCRWSSSSFLWTPTDFLHTDIDILPNNWRCWSLKSQNGLIQFFVPLRCFFHHRVVAPLLAPLVYANLFFCFKKPLPSSLPSTSELFIVKAPSIPNTSVMERPIPHLVQKRAWMWCAAFCSWYMPVRFKNFQKGRETGSHQQNPPTDPNRISKGA